MNKKAFHIKLLSLLMLFFTLNGFGAEVFFSQVYKGSGTTYLEESSSITILPSTKVNGTSVSFVSYDPNASTFNGNNVVGYLKYTDANGQVVRILVNASRPVKQGATKQGLYMAVMRVNGSGQPINASNAVIDPIASPNSISYSGEAYVFVVPGQESYFSTNASASPVNPIQTSSDQVDTFLNSILTSQPVITLTGTLTTFTTCSGTASGTQTLTVSGSSLSADITVSAPTGFEICKTLGGTYTSTLTYTKSGGGSVSSSTFYIRLKSTALNGANGNITASSSADAASKTVATGTSVVNPLPTITITPASATVGLSDPTVLTASGASTYSWSPATYLSGTSTASVTANITVAGTYTYTVTGTSAAGCVNTKNVVLTATNALRGGIIGTDQIICAGSTPATLTSVSTAGGGTGTYTYTWESSTDNSSFSAITGTNSITYSPGALSTTTYFRRSVYDGSNTEYSNVITVSVDPASVAGTATTTTSSICNGGTADITLSGNTGNIQWQSSAPGSGTWFDIAGATSSTYTTDVLTNTTIYRAVVTSGICTAANSGSVTITVSEASIGGTASALPTAVCSGSTSVLSLTGQTGTIQWQSSADDATWSNVSGGTGATTATYTSGTLTATTYFRAVVTNGVCSSVPSNSAVVTVTAIPSAPASITGPLKMVAGTTKTFTAAAVTGATSYTWSLTTGWTGTSTSTTISVTAGTSTGTITVIANSGTCSSPATAITVSIAPDHDGDGLSDEDDLDDDNDGILDTVENGVCDPSSDACDTDGDGIPNKFDLDSDGDGITDVIESDGTDADKDGRADGAIDANGVPATANGGSTPPDTDKDTKKDPYDVDADGDGIRDNIEGQGTYVKPSGKDTDGDGLDDAYDPDNGGTYVSPVDTDKDGKPDFRDLDSDADGIPDNVEGQGTYVKPTGKDTDGDGLDDAYDADNKGTYIDPVDTDKDGKPDYRDVDSDGDGIPDSVEKGSDPNNPVDTDGDGTPDYRDLDSDNDGIPDSIEKGPDGNNPVDTDGDGTPDYRDIDADGDGIPDATEKGADGTKPRDSDGDGIPDYLDIDCDNDGITDKVENNGGATLLDTDKDGIPDILDLDSDGDGITDVVEADGTDADQDGRADGKVDALGVPASAKGGLTPPDTDGDGKRDFQDTESDGDGIPDNLEGQNKYIKPAGKDTDGDGLDDAYDPDNKGTYIAPVDIDKDGKPDFRDLDSDNDGIPDSVEAGKNAASPVDTDGDGAPDFRELDSDNDGIPDADEAGPNPAKPQDTNGDGIPDYQQIISKPGTVIPDGETLLIYKTASKPEILADGSIKLIFTLKVKNNRAEPLTEVMVKDDLTKTFPSPATFTLLDYKTTGSIVKNTSYNGKTAIDLLTTASTLGAFDSASMVLTVNIQPNGFTGAVKNIGDGTAKSKWGPVSKQSIDLSQSGGRLFGAGVPTNTTLPEVEVFISDVVTPNNDGFNDKWIIVKPFNITAAVKIFNRWGQLIYTNSNYNNEWDGRSSVTNEYLPYGSYFYLVELTNKSTNTKTVRKGPIMLKREY